MIRRAGNGTKRYGEQTSGSSEPLGRRILWQPSRRSGVFMQRFLNVACATLVSTVVPIPLDAQGPPAGPPPDVTRAQAQLNAGHVDSSIATLEDFFRRNPAAVFGRLLLGSAYRQKGDHDKALATYGAIAQPRPMRLQAVFAIAGILAGRDQLDAAYD